METCDDSCGPKGYPEKTPYHAADHDGIDNNRILQAQLTGQHRLVGDLAAIQRMAARRWYIMVSVVVPIAMLGAALLIVAWSQGLPLR